MDDRQLWNHGFVCLEGLLASISVETKASLTALLARYRRAKEDFDAVIAEVDAAYVCRECGGQCCLNGKYRINAFDALARVAAQIPTSAAFFRKPLCPYGSDDGCTMEPGLRPADCVLFICDAIDRKLSQQTRMVLVAQEQVLRECLHESSSLTGEHLGSPLLLWAEKCGT